MVFLLSAAFMLKTDGMSKRQAVGSLNSFVWSVILYTVFVILWGAYVRATGSGAGCGSHWPLCNGQVMPVDSNAKTQIEFFHRITSGISLVLVLAVGFWTLKLFPKKSFSGKAAKVAIISILLEALIGAALVLFDLVYKNQSLKRAISVALHFTNTLVLVGSLCLIATSIRRGGVGWKWQTPALKNQAFGFISAFFLLGMAGAVTALGDTLFPARSLVEGIQNDWNTGSHFLIRLRVIHPFLAVTFALFFCPWVYSQMQTFKNTGLLLRGKLLLIFIVSNLVLGVANLLWLAPVWLQILHLSVAMGVWVICVIFLDRLASLEFSSK